MLDAGVISPSTSPQSFPIVLVKKEDGSLRFCVDYRRLNNVTIKDATPLPRIDDSLDSLYGASWFSTLDLQSGYWQVPVHPTDRDITAFSTSSGRHYEFNVLPFRLCNIPATFSCLMESILSGLTWETCLAYLDDVIVFSRTWADHLHRLKKVFQRIRQGKLKLKPSKCVLAARFVAFLGHIISQEGIAPDPDKLRAIADLPLPKDVTEVRAFLGLTF